ncbi:hypothetical protein [Acetobacter sicerae]|nr:hypothetical protein [Acetobacter sicerae]
MVLPIPPDGPSARSHLPSSHASGELECYSINPDVNTVANAAPL